MSRAISRRRGTAQEHESFTGALAELTVDTTNNRLVVHDSSTPGGHPAAPVAYVDDKTSLLAEDSINSTGVGESIISPKFPVQHEENSSNTPLNRLPATVSFVWDRQEEELVSDAGRGGGFPSGGWKSIFDSKGIKFALSVVNQTWDGQPTWGSSGQMSLQSALNLQSDGYEIESHIRASDVINANYDEALNVIATIKGIHEDLGFDVKNGNWFGGTSTPAYRSAIRKFYRSCATVSGIYFPIKPISQYDFSRISLDQTGAFSYNDWVAMVDNHIEKGLPLVFYGHAYVDGLYETKYNDDGDEDVNGEYGWEKIAKLIDYIQAKPGYNDFQDSGSVIITTINDMLDIHGNIIDAGIERRTNPNFVEDDFLRVSRNGAFSSFFTNKLNFIKLDGTTTRAARYSARNENTGKNVTDFGFNAGGDVGDDDVSNFGYNAGAGSAGAKTMFAGWQAGLDNEGNDTVGIGSQAGRGSKGASCVWVGSNAGFLNDSLRSVGFGDGAGRDNEGNDLTAVGDQSARENSGINCGFLGRRAGRNNSGNNTNGHGFQSCDGNTGSNSGGFGHNTLRNNSANNVFAIGYEAGEDNTLANRFLVEHRTITSNPLIDGDFSSGGLAIGAPASPLADSRIGANRMTFYLDESTDKLHFRVKYADGTTIKEGEVNLV